ncbi:MAG TPA: MlaE family lipid ABC transporter permease subunit [Terrimicrobiaceae bacterium]
MASPASILEVVNEQGGSRLVFSGRLDANGVARAWERALSATGQGGRVSIDASEVDYCDGSGIALLWELQRRGAVEIVGLKPEIARLLEPFADAERKTDETKQAKTSAVETLGKAAAELATDLREQVSFLGQVAVMSLRMVRHPRELRWTDVWTTYERAGVQALVVVGLISFLTGLIMAFQAAPPLREFGVDLYVVNLVSLAMLRELGPIMTAIVLAGRSGSAFAAEIGTMKVNEEINALTTMGLDPIRFLVAPRVLAGVLVMPVLTIYADLVGVAGGILVMTGRGYSLVILWNQFVSAVGINDLFAGLIKGFVFGALVAGVGCLRGLQTKSGASAVGISTTRSVVTSIFLIVVVDAIFAVVYYAIDF